MAKVRSRKRMGQRKQSRLGWAETLEGRALLAVFTVNTINDTVAVNLTTGQDASGNISLRGAIMAANKAGGAHTINLPAGNYALTETGPGEDLAESGDLDIKSNITLTGAGASTTTIDGLVNDRVFQVLGARTVVMNQLTITNGSASVGGGIWNQGTLTLNDCVVTKNIASGLDGVSPTLMSSSGGDGGTGYGGGIYNSPLGTLTLNGTTVSENLARGGNGGNATEGRSGNGENPSPVAGGVGGKGGAGLGGGLYNNGVASILANSYFTANEARGGNGGLGGKGGAGYAFDQGVTAGAAGGAGGRAGVAAGGGVYHVGTNKTLTINSANFDAQLVNGGNGGNAGGGGGGGPGGTEFGPALGGRGANGGIGGNATGGAIHNSGGNITIAATTFRQAIVTSGAGGTGGAGGIGGSISPNAVKIATYNGANGNLGGNGGNGGQALGGAIHSTAGTISLGQQTNLLLNVVTAKQGGEGGRGGDGTPGGSVPSSTELPYGFPGAGGNAGLSAPGSLAAGGGLSATGGTVNMQASNVSQNMVTGGKGANGARGGDGAAGLAHAYHISENPLVLKVNGGDYGRSSNGGNGGAGKGGGMYINGATLNVQTTLFLGNQALGGGGGFGSIGANWGGLLQNDNVGDAADGTNGGTGGSGQGGGISLDSGTVNVTTSTFSSGLAQGSLGGAGGPGGTGATAALGTQGQGGDAGKGGLGGIGGMGVGGAVSATKTGGTMSITRSTFSNNEAAGRSGGDGGAAGVVGQGATLGANSVGGAAGKGGDGRGGAFFASQGTLNLSNSTLDGNRAAGDNGGLGGVGQLPNANGADGASGMGRGGAGFHGGTGVASLVNNTITRNRISAALGSDLGSGGGLANESGTFNLLNNLIALNFYDSLILGPGKQTKGTFNSQGTNLITNADGSAGFVASDLTGTGLNILNAKVDTLKANGGPTQTCKLLTGSLAINAGTTANAPTADQRGTARNGKVDIGAFEA